MSYFIDPCLARNLKDVPAGKIDRLAKVYYATEKLDGYYVQVHHNTDGFFMYTRNGKSCFVPELAEYLLTFTYEGSYVIECEYLYDCEGKLGDRHKCAPLSSYIKKPTFDLGRFTGEHKLVLFNVLAGIAPAIPKVHNVGLVSIEEVFSFTKDPSLEGYVLVHKDFMYKRGRSNLKIKIKPPNTDTVTILGATRGEGHNASRVGSLRGQSLKDHKQYTVGSGIPDSMKNFNNAHLLVGTTLVIEYEYITETNERNQPRIKAGTLC